MSTPCAYHCVYLAPKSNSIARPVMSSAAPSYRHKYPNTSEVPSEGYLAMAAIDLAVRHQQTQQDLAMRIQNLAPRLHQLNDALDDLITSARKLID